MPQSKSRAGSAGEGRTYGVGAVERVIAILKAFNTAHPELSLPQVEAVTKLPKSTAFRLLDNLIHGDLVARDPATGLYRLGLGLLPLAETAKASFSIVEYALPVMRKIRATLNETSYVSVRIGDHRVDVEQVVGLQELRRVLELGIPKPLYAGSASKVFLASMSDREIEDFLSRIKPKRHSEGTITEPEALWREIAKIRKRGFAQGSAELNTGGIGVAAPIHDPAGQVIGTLGITVPTPRFSDRLGPLAILHAKHIAASIRSNGRSKPARR